VAEGVIRRVAAHRHQQEHQTQRRDVGLAAHVDQRHAADAQHRTDHLTARDPLVQDQHVRDDTGDGHHGDDGARYSGGGVQDAVILAEEVQHRLDQAQQHQRADGLGLQGEGEQRPATGFPHQRVDQNDQRHGGKGDQKTEGQQHGGLGHLQRQLGKHEAHAENGAGQQGEHQRQGVGFLVVHRIHLSFKVRFILPY